MIFNIDLNRLFMQLLPSFFRQPLIFGILRAAKQGLGETYNKFAAARNEHNYKLHHNGQVCYLRAVLNDAFGGGFDILNVEREGDWLYAITENGSGILLTFGEDGNTAEVGDGQKIPFVYNEVLLNAAQNSFIVSVPYMIFQTRLPEVAAVVDKYKLISKRAIYVAKS